MFKRYLLAITLTCCSFVSHASLLYSNGSIVNASGLSIITSPATTFGFGAQTNSQNSVADNFTILSGETWSITDLDFFAYQSFASGFTLGNVTWSIVLGDVTNGTVVASNLNALTNGGLEGYRVTSTSLTNTDRSIFRANADIDDLVLSAGNYWLRWSLTGSASSGPWVPYLPGSIAGNAQQSLNSGVYSSITDGGSQLSVELPFAINGSVVTQDVPEPSTLAILVLSMIGLGARRFRK